MQKIDINKVQKCNPKIKFVKLDFQINGLQKKKNNLIRNEHNINIKKLPNWKINNSWILFHKPLIFLKTIIRNN